MVMDLNTASVGIIKTVAIPSLISSFKKKTRPLVRKCIKYVCCVKNVPCHVALWLP